MRALNHVVAVTTPAQPAAFARGQVVFEHHDAIDEAEGAFIQASSPQNTRAQLAPPVRWLLLFVLDEVLPMVLVAVIGFGDFLAAKETEKHLNPCPQAHLTLQCITTDFRHGCVALGAVRCPVSRPVDVAKVCIGAGEEPWEDLLLEAGVLARVEAEEVEADVEEKQVEAVEEKQRSRGACKSGR